jgi:uncharacterized protein (DUF1501 family)
MINRRTFIQKSAISAAGALLIPEILKAENINAPLRRSSGNNRKLVVIQLSGGNDGLNMIVPYTNSLYYKARPTIAIPAKEVLKASNMQGFNPVMTEFKELFDKNKLSIINGAGYPNPNRSHFRSMDIWQSASDSDKYVSTGWIGRYISSLPEGRRKPHTAIDVDNELALALKGEGISGMALQNPDFLYNSLHRGIFRPLAKTESESSENPALNYLRRVMNETVSSVDYLHDTIQKTGDAKPKKRKIGKLSDNLSLIAGMISSGLSTEIYYTSLSGFDTHVNQKPQQDKLLKELSQGVDGFVKELEGKRLMDNVLIMVFSEFGRRVAQNASGGTDHGCASNVLLIGNNLKKLGIYNDPPNLYDLDKGDLKFTVDFRSVYATIIQRHLNGDANMILGETFPGLTFI